jgi:1,4-dihydroxy-2-naphthoate octaprenyltransferase
LLLIAFVYLFGVVIALATGTPVDRSGVVVGLLVLLPLSASVHYANEYADYETDGLTIRTPFSGGSGALQRSGLGRRSALVGAWVTGLVGAGLSGIAYGLDFLPLAGLGILALGTFFGWMYSLAPLALGWRGWGELDNALLGGVALPFYGYVVQTGRVEGGVLLACLPFGALVFTNLLATTWADRAADFVVGKRTLATRWPLNQLRALYWAVVAGAYLSLLLLGGRVFPAIVAWSSIAVLPVSIWGGAAYTRRHSPFPSVFAMVCLLGVQLISWWSTAGFCCLI